MYIVDPEYILFGPRAFKEWFRALFNLIRWRKAIKCLAPKFIFDKKTTFSRISKEFNKRICATLFYGEYRKFFSDDILLNAEYITHIVNVQKDYPTDEACLDYARLLIEKYSKAQMVITSRIHAALPSLGLETPVFFIKSWAIDSGDIKGRLDGLTDFFHYQLEVTGDGIKPASVGMTDLLKNGPISLSTPLRNSDSYVPYKNALIEKTEAFVKACSE